MKFATEKKSTFCIYTDPQADYSVEKMECELKSLRTELEETREALRLQTMRCRQLVAAFSARMHEKEAELQADRRLKDQQLSRVVRALVVLEARLRREQRTIREQLCQKDGVIRNQQIEIMRLRRLQNHRPRRNDKVEIGMSVQASRINEEAEEEAQDMETKSKEVAGNDRILRRSQSDYGEHYVKQNDVCVHYDNLFSNGELVTTHGESIENDENQNKLFLKEKENCDDFSLGVIIKRPEFRRSQSASVVRFKKNNQNKTHTTHRIFRSLSKQDDHFWAEKNQNKDQIERYNELQKLASTLSQELDGQTEDDCGVDQEEEVRRDLSKDYHHNPVLECVNQILLRDQDDYDSLPHENRLNSSTDEERDKTLEAFSECEIKTENKHGDKNNYEVKQAWIADRHISPPVKTQSIEEKTCSLMSSQKLSVARNSEVDEFDVESSTKPPSLPDKCPIPPALPPKPPQLGSLFFRKKKVSFQDQSKFQSAHCKQSKIAESEEKSDLTEHNIYENSQVKNFNLHKDNGKVRSNTAAQSCVHMNGDEKPRQRQILSNGSLKITLNENDVSENVDYSKTNGYSHKHNFENDKNGYISFHNLKEKLTNFNVSGLLVNKKSNAHINKQNHLNNDKQDLNGVKLTQTELISSSGDSAENINKSPSRNTNCDKIKIGSSVSSLITGSCGKSIVTELTQEETATGIHVSALVKRFEVLHSVDKEPEHIVGNENEDLRNNFEEFKLEDVDMDNMEGEFKEIQETESEETVSLLTKAESQEENKVTKDEEKRPEADGAETRNVHNYVVDNNETYEHFLESTGLSQKSILTPSRMLSNHRNVLKPRDVKHRSKVLKAQSVVNNNTAAVVNGSIVKYWMEPFL